MDDFTKWLSEWAKPAVILVVLGAVWRMGTGLFKSGAMVQNLINQQDETQQRLEEAIERWDAHIERQRKWNEGMEEWRRRVGEQRRGHID